MWPTQKVIDFPGRAALCDTCQVPDPVVDRSYRRFGKTFLPVANVGGEVVGIPLVSMRQVSTVVAGASALDEVTLTSSSQAMFVVVGLGFSIYYLHYDAIAAGVVVAISLSEPVLFLWR